MRAPTEQADHEVVGATTRPWRYAIGMFGTSIPINMFLAYMAFFYVDQRGLDVRTYGVVLLVYAVIDACDNPIFGYLSDRTRTRWGRRRPWLVIGAPLLAASLIAFYAVPSSLDGMALVVWFAVFAILTETFDSLINANYGALLPELFPLERKRALANSLRQGFQLVAMVISIAGTPALVDLLGEEGSTVGYARIAVLYGALATVVIIFMAVGAKENPNYARSRPPALLDTVRTILTNPRFWLIAVCGACYAGAMALVLAGLPFFAKYSLGLTDGLSVTILQGSVILASAFFLVLWTALVRRFGALPVWRAALLTLALAFVPMYFVQGLVGGILAGLLIGLGYSGVMATADLIVARLLDDDAARNGTHREAMFLAAFGFFNRLNALIKAGAFASLAYFFGYQSGEAPGDDPAQAFRILLCVYPCLLVGVAAAVSRFVRLPTVRPPDANPLVENAESGVETR
ncbi:MAG: MFS transporter [Propionibacteriaceae bacterium]